MEAQLQQVVIYLFAFVFISACSFKATESDKHESIAVDEHGLSLLFGQQSLDFVDAPLMIESLSLINSNDEKVTLLQDAAINPANLSDLPQLIKQYPALDTGRYTKLHIRLVFDESSKINFYHETSEDLLESQYVNAEGQILGIEADTLDILVALKHKDGKTIDADKAYALQVNWHLNRLFNIHKGENSVLVEMKPSIEAFFIEKPSTPVQFKGKITEAANSTFNLQTDWANDAISFINKKTDNSALESSDVIVGEATLSSSNNGLTVKNYQVFKPNNPVYKGVVLAIGESKTRVMVGQFNHKNFLKNAKEIVSIDNRYVSAPTERAQAIIKKNEPKVLKGAAQTASFETKSSSEHTYIIEYGKDIQVETKQTTNEKSVWANALIMDGLSLNEPIKVKLNDLKEPLTNGIHRIKATKTERDCNEFESEDVCVELAVIEQIAINNVADHQLYTWDFNYYQEFLEKNLEELAMTPVEKKRALEENSDTEILNLYDGTGIVLTSGLFNFFDTINKRYAGCCRSFTWGQVNSQSDEPFLEVEISSLPKKDDSTESPPETHYFYEYSTFAKWFETYKIPLYLEEVIISGKVDPKNECSLETNRIYLRLITDPSSRKHFRKKFLGGDFSMANRGMSTAAFAAAWSAIGVAGLAAIGGLAVLIKKLRNKAKYGSTSGASAKYNLLDVESSIKNQKLKIPSTDAPDVNKLPPTATPTTKKKFFRNR